MKTFKLFSLFIAAAFSIGAAKAQTADEIISKHVEAIGGAENWKKVNSMVQTGSVSFQGMDISVVATIVHNKGMRRDISLMGMNGYEIVTPTEGWRYMPFGGGQTAAEPITPDELKESQDDLDAQGNLVDFKAKGHSAELLGKEDVDGTECYKIKLTQKGGKVTTYFIDPQTYYAVKALTTIKANGQEAEVTYGYSNYQKLPEGIIVPMTMSIPLGGPGQNADFVVSKIEINKTIDDSVFKPAK
jgi:outer membrane lipoprotein-sorting protein